MTLNWTCRVCSQPILDSMGYLELSMEEMRTYQREVKAFHKKHSGFMTLGELMEHPDQVEWKAMHSKCDPEPDVDSWYWISLDRISDVWQMLSWTSHLMGKSWIGDTNWHVLLKEVADRNHE